MDNLHVDPEIAKRLRPCIQCGSAPWIYQNASGWIIVECPECENWAPPQDSVNAAISAWNLANPEPDDG